MIFLYLSILALIAGWREVEILIQRGSYKPENFWNVYWNWKPVFMNIKIKIDSFHFANGLFVLAMCIMLRFEGNILWFDGTWGLIAQVVALWLYYMYIRNIMLHIILPKKKRWFFIVPIFGGILEDLFA